MRSPRYAGFLDDLLRLAGFVGGAHATAGARSSEIIGLRFSDDLYI